MFRMDGQLEFYDTSEITLVTTAEHTQATDLEWDPSGRYIVTSVSYWTQKVKETLVIYTYVYVYGYARICYSHIIYQSSFTLILYVIKHNVHYNPYNLRFYGIKLYLRFFSLLTTH